MIIKGSMNYDSHGRRRRRIQARRKKKAPMGWSPVKRKEYQANKERNKQKKIASAPIGEYKVPKDTSYKKEISKQYTVAIAYNKGAYQVIPNSDVKHIGK